MRNYIIMFQMFYYKIIQLQFYGLIRKKDWQPEWATWILQSVRAFIFISHGLHTNCSPVTREAFSIITMLVISILKKEDKRQNKNVIVNFESYDHF